MKYVSVYQPYKIRTNINKTVANMKKRGIKTYKIESGGNGCLSSSSFNQLLGRFGVIHSKLDNEDKDILNVTLCTTELYIFHKLSPNAKIPFGDNDTVNLMRSMYGIKINI